MVSGSEVGIPAQIPQHHIRLVDGQIVTQAGGPADLPDDLAVRLVVQHGSQPGPDQWIARHDQHTQRKHR